MPTDLTTTLAAIEADAERHGFIYSSEALTGHLLAVLAASKPRGRLLELGTGFGHGTAWLLSGMDAQSVLTTVDGNLNNSEIAQTHLGHDKRARFVVREAGAWLESAPANAFDLLFADAPAGKYDHLEEALRTLNVGGFYIVDDMRRLQDGTDEYAAPAAELVRQLTARPDFIVLQIDWATGLLIAVKTKRS